MSQHTCPKCQSLNCNANQYGFICYACGYGKSNMLRAMSSGPFGGAGGPGLGGGGISQALGVNPADDPQTASPSVGDSVTVSEARDIVERILETDIVPFLWGPPGVGKSSIIKQICEDRGWEMIDFRLSTVNPVDLMGMPTVDKAKGVAKWLPPEFLPREDDKKVGVLFLDELNLAPLAVQAAAYQLILDKRVGAYRFPKTWKMVSAGNRETDRANVYKLNAPLANRFMHISVRSDIDTWEKWARKHDINAAIISFLFLRPTLLFQMPTDSQKAFPTPRSWSYVSDFMKAFGYQPGRPPGRAFEISVLGAIGNAVGQEFLKYVSNFNLMQVNQVVEEFIQSGKINLPRLSVNRDSEPAVLSTRFAITTAITNAYKNGKIDRSRFEDFLSHLNAEERASVRRVLAEAECNLSENENFTYLEADIDEASTSMLVNDETVFVSKEGMAEITSPNGQERELITYEVKKGSKAISIKRGANSSQPHPFFAGSLIKPL